MNEESNNSKTGFQFKLYHLLLFILAILIISTGILAASIYLFINPSMTSGIIFALAIILLLITPITIAFIFYFKKIKNIKFESKEKKKIKIVESSRVE